VQRPGSAWNVDRTERRFRRVPRPMVPACSWRYRLPVMGAGSPSRPAPKPQARCPRTTSGTRVAPRPGPPGRWRWHT